MTKDEALKLALEALHGFIPYLPLNDEAQCGRYDEAITAIKEALAQPEQLREENERLHVENRRLIDRIETIGVPVGVGGFATTTSQRTWVAIDDEDYIKAFELCDFDKEVAFEFFEAALKAKNT